MLFKFGTQEKESKKKNIVYYDVHIDVKKKLHQKYVFNVQILQKINVDHLISYCEYMYFRLDDIRE